MRSAPLELTARLLLQSPVPADRHTHVPGDTLWKIAGELDPKADPREIVDLLVEARHTTALTPGETIIWLGR